MYYIEWVDLMMYLPFNLSKKKNVLRRMGPFYGPVSAVYSIVFVISELFVLEIRT
jgi:hypothetical protein